MDCRQVLTRIQPMIESDVRVWVDGSAGMTLVGYREPGAHVLAEFHYRPNGEFFFSEDQVSDAVCDLMGEALMMMDPGDRSERALAIGFRFRDSSWTIGSLTGREARRWKMTPGNFQVLAAEVCPL